MIATTAMIATHTAIRGAEGGIAGKEPAVRSLAFFGGVWNSAVGLTSTGAFLGPGATGSGEGPAGPAWSMLFL